MLNDVVQTLVIYFKMKAERVMDLFMDESGNTGDLARTTKSLDFGGQPVFSLAALGIVNECHLSESLTALRRKHNIQATELKLSKLLKRKPDFALEVVNLLVESEIPFFVEIVDKKYQLAVSITNCFIWPPYFNALDSKENILFRNIVADYIYDRLSNEIFFEFVECMHAPSNEKIGSYFDILKEFVSKDSHELAHPVAGQIEESIDDFHRMIEQENEKAHRRFLPLPDIGKRDQEIWILPNYASFTNIYARLNLFLSGNLDGTRIFHDEQSHFDEIIAGAKYQVENAEIDPESFRMPFSDYNFQQFSELFFKASPESIGIQLADIVAGLSMRWYQAHLQKETDTRTLDEAIGFLLYQSNPDRGVGINIVGPHDRAQQLFDVHGY